MDATNHSSEHLTAQELAAFLDRELSTENRRRVAGHLHGCATCRGELSRASAALGRNKSRRRVLAGIASLAAAAGLAALLLVPGSGDGPGDQPAVRGGAPEGTTVFQTLVPANGEVVDGSDLVFVWRSAGVDARYELTVTDSRGDPVWSAPSSDTLLALSPDVSLVPGEMYFWQVDALLAAARSATTVFRSFTVEP